MEKPRMNMLLVNLTQLGKVDNSFVGFFEQLTLTNFSSG